MRQQEVPMHPVALALAACLALGCEGKLVRLGSATPVPFRFGPATRVPELASASQRDNPTLTADLLEVYFITNEDEHSRGDVWVAKRTSRTGAFGAAGPVAELAGPDGETSSAIASDGLSLWFGSNRAGGSGGYDIWVSQRASRQAAWSAPMNLVGLNTADEDIPRPPGQHGLVMPMASTKKTPLNQLERNYQTYFATRGNTGAPFDAPSAIPGLAYRDRLIVDGFLTEDGLALFFTSSANALDPLDAGSGADAGAADGDIFVAFRRSTDEPFNATQPLEDINTSATERDPWLSPDGSVFYFTSDRDGVTNIYSAPARPRSSS